MKETLPENKHTPVEVDLDFPHQDDNNWLEVEAGGVRYPQYPSPLEVKMLLQSQADKYEQEKGEMVKELIQYTFEACPYEGTMIRAFLRQKYGVDLSE
jgi:hypothetical protein